MITAIKINHDIEYCTIIVGVELRMVHRKLQLKIPFLSSLPKKSANAGLPSGCLT